MAGLGVISDMDGGVCRGRQAIPGAQEFVDRLRRCETPFVFLTNNSEQTPIYRPAFMPWASLPLVRTASREVDRLISTPHLVACGSHGRGGFVHQDRRSPAPLVRMTSAYQSKDFFRYRSRVPLPSSLRST